MKNNANSAAPKTEKSLTRKSAAFIGSLFAVLGLAMLLFAAKPADACSSYSYDCGGYDYSSYDGGCSYDCGSPYQFQTYGSGCDYGCGGYSNLVYSYAPGMGGCASCSSGYGGYDTGGYNYVQYPYQTYTYFPQAPAQSNNGGQYVQYPYPKYVYFQNPNNQAAASASPYSVWGQPISSAPAVGSGSYGSAYPSSYGIPSYSQYSSSNYAPVFQVSSGNNNGFYRTR